MNTNDQANILSQQHNASNNSTVILKVISQDGVEVSFKTRANSLLQRLMDAYCKRQSLSRACSRFFYDGVSITNECTAMSMGMEDGACIDVIFEQSGG